MSIVLIWNDVGDMTQNPVVVSKVGPPHVPVTLIRVYLPTVKVSNCTGN
jgi:hypothetical protein